MNSLDLIWGLALKDLKLTSRSLHSFLTTMFFAVLILVVFHFAFEPGSQATRESLPGILWVALLFPGVIQLNRSFQIEQEQGTLQGLLLAPVDRGVLFLGKTLANVIFLMAIDLFIVLIFVVLFNPPLTGSSWWLLPLLFLATVGFAAVGTIFAAMVTTLRTQDVLLPVLLFPIIIPIILAAVSATQELLAATGLQAFGQWMRILAGFDVLFLSAGFLLFEYVVAE